MTVRTILIALSLSAAAVSARLAALEESLEDDARVDLRRQRLRRAAEAAVRVVRLVEPLLVLHVRLRHRRQFQRRQRRERADVIRHDLVGRDRDVDHVALVRVGQRRLDGAHRHQLWRNRPTVQGTGGGLGGPAALVGGSVVIALVAGATFTWIGTVGQLPGGDNGSGEGGLGLNPFTSLRGMLDREGNVELFRVSGEVSVHSAAMEARLKALVDSSRQLLAQNLRVQKRLF